MNVINKLFYYRRLSQRPSKSELEQRNILPQEITSEDRHKEREKVCLVLL